VSRRLLLAFVAASLVVAGGLSTAATTPAADARATGPAPATDDAVTAIAARLAKPATLRGRFEQEKAIAGFRHPLRSSGSFLLVRGRGIAWDTTAPFPSSAVLTASRLSTRVPGDEARVVFDATAAPATAAVSTLFLALVEGDVAALSARFDIDVAEPAENGAAATGRWTLRLRPRDAALAKAVAGIRLAGDRHVEEVEVREAGGDVTTLRFAGLAEAPPASADEVARLD
jgi:hypothetical protein